MKIAASADKRSSGRTHRSLNILTLNHKTLCLAASANLQLNLSRLCQSQHEGLLLLFSPALADHTHTHLPQVTLHRLGGEALMFHLHSKQPRFVKCVQSPAPAVVTARVSSQPCQNNLSFADQMTSFDPKVVESAASALLSSLRC